MMVSRLRNYLLISVLFLSGCTTTFFGSVIILTFRDILLYIAIAFFIALLIAIRSSANSRRAFWIWFILSLILTPLAGFIYLLIGFSKRSI
jgi:hypothetical protein